MIDVWLHIIVSLLEDRVKLLRELEIARLDSEILEGVNGALREELAVYKSRNPPDLN